MANTQTGLVTIKIDQGQLAGVRAMLSEIKNGAELALRNALNKTVDGCTTDTAKAVYSEINLTQTRIKRDIGQKKATLQVLSAQVYSRGKKVPLIEYGARQVKQGVTFQIKRTGGRSAMHYGFIQMTNKGLQVLHRKTVQVGTGKPIGVPKAGYLYTFPARWPDVYRAETRIMYGPSIPDIWGRNDIFRDVETKAIDRLVKRLDEEANYILLKSQGLA
jgi:uncharacterized protein YoxC